MKVLITAPSLDENENVSGISTLVREIISNSEIDFSHFSAGRKDAEKAGIGWVLRQCLLPIQLYKIIKVEKPDLVHINTAFVPLSIVRDAVICYVSKILAVPVILHSHGGRYLIEDFNNKALEFITKRMLQKSDTVIVLSEFEKVNLTRRWPDLPIEILPNAISTDNALLIEKSPGEKTIIFFGRIHESKGLHEIIETCKILSEENLQFSFRCFGAGPEKDFFVSEMNAVLGEKFHFGGVVSGVEKWRELAKADIFLLPSRYGEGLPLAMLEAMASRCVPVCADVASVRSVISDGENGFIVRPHDAVQTAEKLKGLLSGNCDLDSLGAAARQTVVNRFSIDNYLKELITIYSATISHRDSK